MRMPPASVALYGAIGITTLGMMLVVGGVIAAGLFLPGVLLIGVGMIAFAAAAVLHALHGAAAGTRPDRSAAPDGR